jgi:hypothetical protein
MTTALLPHDRPSMFRVRQTIPIRMVIDLIDPWFSLRDMSQGNTPKQGFRIDTLRNRDTNLTAVIVNGL